ncbi:MAG: PKD domain-containing protein, partial [Lewinella sp.]|nr:PKD domain-containing protein [Lewinella sp.]
MSIAILILLGSKGLAQNNCTADFDYAASCNSITFTPVSGNNNLNYSWDFGDNTPKSTERTPTHVFFTDSGQQDFEVTLTVSGGNCNAEMTKTVNFTVGNLPDVDFQTPQTLRPFANCDATITDPKYNLDLLNVSSTAATNAHYSIDWGDGTAISEENSINRIDHLYNDVGSFDIVVTVRGDNQCIARRTFPFFNGGKPKLGVSFINDQACVPQKLEFPLRDFENNVPGTRYEISVDDGTPGVVIQHPPNPPVYEHLFTKSSCDPEFTALNGQFTVTFVASNTCTELGITQPTILTGTVEVSSPPEADFQILPAPTQCEGSIFEFRDSSIKALYYAGGCTDRMISKWSISPNSGYEIISGDLDSEDFSARFDEAGSYTITLIYQPLVKTGCAADTIRKKICVVPFPVADFTLSPNVAGCINTSSTFTATNTSNTLESCDTSQTKYIWSVFLQESNCTEVPDVDSLPTGNPNDVRYRFNTSGVYGIVLTTMNQCGTDTDTSFVTIADAPRSTILPIDSIFCGNAQIQFELDQTQSSSCNDDTPPTFKWTFENGTPGMSTQEVPDPVRFNYTGTNGEIQTFKVTLTTTGACGSTTTSTNVQISAPPPAPTLASNAPLCAGKTLKLEITSDTVGLEFSWTGPNGFTSAEASPEIKDVTIEASGVYTLVVTNSASRCFNSRAINVDIFALPPVVIDPAEASICIDGTQRFRVTGAETFTWMDDGNTLDATTGDRVTATPTQVRTYQYIVTGTDVNGCVSKDTAVLVVNPLPVVEAGPDEIICVGEPFQLLGATPAGPGGEWSGEIVNAGGQVQTGQPGTYTLTYTFTDENGCTASDTMQICVLARPDAVFTLDKSDGCVENGLTVTATNESVNLNDCSPSTYVWSSEFVGADCHEEADGHRITTENDETAVFLFTKSGDYLIKLTVSNDHCTEVAESEMPVSVGDKPDIAIDSLPNLCEGVNGNAILTPTAGVEVCNNSITSYSWSFPGAVSPSASDQLVPGNVTYNIANGDSYTVQFSATNSCGTTTDEANFRILEGIIADAAIPDFGCAPFTLSPENNSSGSDIRFLWTVSLNGVTIDQSDKKNPSFMLTETGVYEVTLGVANDQCGGDSWTGSIEISALPEVMLDPIAPICSGTEFEVSVSYPNQDLVESVMWDI